MLNLKVQMTREPIVEKRLLDVACGGQLHAHPVEISIVIDVHWKMIHLSYPNEPVTLEEFDEKVVCNCAKEAHVWSEN